MDVLGSLNSVAMFVGKGYMILLPFSRYVLRSLVMLPWCWPKLPKAANEVLCAYSHLGLQHELISARQLLIFLLYPRGPTNGCPNSCGLHDWVSWAHGKTMLFLFSVYTLPFLIGA
jgi:hypothetical protein